MEIDKDLSSILRLVEDNLIVKVIAPTSSGKSTNLPKFFGKKYKTIVVVSEINTANSLNKLNFPNVTYVASELYKKQIIDRDFNDVDLLIIDEIDTCSFNNFLIMSLWKKSSKNIKLLLTSRSKHNLFPEFPTYIVKKYFNYPIEIRYLKDNKNYEDAVSELINLVYQTHNSTIKGDFLIFALSKNSVKNIISKLSKLNLDVDIFSTYEMKLEMFKKGDRRKVFITTDIGKTASPFKNVGCIFDTMREKKDIITLTGGYRKKVKYISKRDADLRASRANKSAIVYRMISENSFNKLPEISEEYLFKNPLHHLMIDIYKEKLNPYDILFNFEKKELDDMFALFIKFGLLDISGKLTKKAMLIRKLNLGLKPSLLIVESPDSTRYESVVLASLIDNFPNYSPFLFTKGIDKNKGVFEYEMNYDEHIKKHFNRFRGRSDFETLLYLWLTYKNEDLELKKWCDINFIDYTYLNNVKLTIEKINKIYKFYPKNFIIEEIIDKLDPIIKYIYSGQTLNLDLNQTIFANYMDKKENLYKIDSLSINLIDEKRPKEIYPVIVSTGENINSIVLSYVSPLMEYQIII